MTTLIKRIAFISSSVAILLLAGCNLFDGSAKAQPTQNDHLDQRISQAEEKEGKAYQDSTQFTPLKHHKTLVNYVEQIALDLVDTMLTDEDISIGVASFVDLDAHLNNSSQLGNQLSESFIHQLQKFGYGVVDFKTTDHVLVNKRGDFVFSRDIEKLARRHLASHVLSGTLIYRGNGVEVNTRIIDVNSKRVVASSQKILPYFVLNNADINLQRASVN
ncbi:FlgO family outer membrane protein [Pseudoalteromonas porphyrae]|uniref:Flagellar biosynthesis protein FlgO n=1 Tax=Pseudoalteromonas porphyrae TaxID=187330 RepID=A0A0N1ELI9_9GAMM|nr:FlgO family outer membrane protein [Pseudoalteromonas porphyrae]KPH63854.1 flagellar biosynthesis protein FlgO [Pseudoalteromonas porphyrae]